MNDKYDHQQIEEKWQKRWLDEHVFSITTPSLPSGASRHLPSGRGGSSKYILDMFPYPSGDGLHVGHPEGYTATDIYSRYLRMKGVKVLHPMGWDAFGLPAENAAIAKKTHPRAVTEKNIANFKRQIQSLGFSYDWDREVNTTDPAYYKWTQWIFLQLFKRGLAYEKESPIWWCPKDKTGLANEEVVDGKCDRCGTKVEKKMLRQWMLKITAYADRLLTGLDKLDWPASIKHLQRNWIGKSEGAEVVFDIVSEALRDAQGENSVVVFTTRPDTLFGATYLVLSPEHELVAKITTPKQKKAVEKYVKSVAAKSDLERTSLEKDKTGVFTGAFAVNPVNNEKIPVWIADYVLSGYGTGAIMAVPAHDERDWEFAKKFKLPIVPVVMPTSGEPHKGAEYRRTISATIIRKRDGKVMAVKWKKFDWVSIPIGGIENGENPLEAAEREVYEETGYKTKAVEQLGDHVEMHFYADNKNVWRHRHDYPVLLEIINEKPDEVAAEESEKHEVIWLTPEELHKQMTHPDNLVGLDRYIKKNYAYVGEGIMINSGKFDSLTSSEGRKKIVAMLASEEKATPAINYKLRDWVFSRQRYWGEPIPLVHCEKCGVVPIPEDKLPLELPDVKNYEPTGTGESPLAGIKDWVNTTCPKCGGPAKRETNTMPQWAGSCWYYLRYLDPKNDKQLASPEAMKAWLPVDLYVGGAEHAVLHLLYARFWHMVLFDAGVIPKECGDEPFLKLKNQGLILGPDGEKMSKSRGNVINPDEIVEKYGADTLRMYEMFMGPFEDAKPWDTNGIIGIRRFLDKAWDLVNKNDSSKWKKDRTNKNHRVVKAITKGIENFQFNTCISDLMKYVNLWKAIGNSPDEDVDVFLKILSPFAPHLSEELWAIRGHKQSISLEEWPSFIEDKITLETVTIAVQVNGKLRATIITTPGRDKEDLIKEAMSEPNVKKYLTGDPKKVIFVPDRLINFVV